MPMQQVKKKSRNGSTFKMLKYLWKTRNKIKKYLLTGRTILIS